MMTYQEQVDAQKAKNAEIMIAWRHGWEDRQDGKEPNPDIYDCDHDGYFAGYNAKQRIAKYNNGAAWLTSKSS